MFQRRLKEWKCRAETGQREFAGNGVQFSTHLTAYYNHI